MVDIIRDEECEGLIQVDANNAFNTINRKVLLNNIYYLCPEIAIFTSNCYSIPARLFVVGGVEIESKEGTTQGDPIAMPIYAIGVRPLILALLEQATEPPPKTNESTVRLCAIADDLSGAGKLVSLRHWWTKVLELGPTIGYTAKPSKSWLIVKEGVYEKAVKIFEGSGLNITTEGRRHIGAVIGTNAFKDSFVSDRVTEWIEQVRKLTNIARTEPHAAFSCLNTASRT